MKLEERLEGAIGERGRFTGYSTNKNGKETKDATYDYKHIDWERHYSGKAYYGISPVKIIQNGTGRKGSCRWIGWDLDVEEEPEEFCKKVFRINQEFFCYRTSSNRYHIHHYLDDWTDVEECRKFAVSYEAKWKEIWKKGVDTSHSLPKGYTIEQGKPGGWLFMPYCPHEDLKNNNLCGYSPKGKPLKKEQIEFAITWRKFPLIRSMVGAESGEGGREKLLFIAKQVIVHNKLNLTPYQVNEQFSEPLTGTSLTKEINSHERKDYEGEYNKEYLEEHTNAYLKAINGYWLKELGGAGGEEATDEQTKFIEDVIYMKLDDYFFDNSTEQQYPRKNLNIIYGQIETKKSGVPTRFFSRHPNKKMVEMGVYRPDLYKEGQDPININDEGLKVLNHYRPGKLQIMLPDTPERKKELDTFMALVEGLTEREGYGTAIRNKKEMEFKLRDHLLDHLSMPFKRPGIKTRSAIVLHSKEFQTGKSTLFETVRKALGEKNCTIIKPENAISRELSFVEHQLVFVDEIKIDGSIDEKKSILNRLKPLITQELHDSRPLFKEWRQVYATLNLMFSTNHKDAMALDHKEARYTCIDVAKDREEMGGDDFFIPIWNWLKYPDKYPNTFCNVVKGFLTNREFTPGFDHAGKSLKTKFLSEMAEHGGHPLYTDVKNLFRQRETPFDQSVISIHDAWLYCKKEYSLKGKSNDFADILKQLGAEQVGECKHKRTKKHPMLYLIRNQGFFADKTLSEIVNYYWKPTGTISNTGNEKWNLTPGDVAEIDDHLKEVDAYEDFKDNRDEKEEDEAFIEVKRRRRLEREKKEKQKKEMEQWNAKNVPCNGDGELR